MLTLTQRLDRLKVRTAELEGWRERAANPVDGWTFDGTPIAVGSSWPYRNGEVHFAAKATVPKDWPLAETRLNLDLGGESVITLSFAEGVERSYGLDPYHQEFPLHGHAFTIHTDSVARLPFGEPNRTATLKTARLIWIDEPVRALHLLLTQIAEAVSVLTTHEVAPHLLEAGEKALASLLWPSSTATYVARTAGSVAQQKIWQLPELLSSPAALTDEERASVAAAHATLTATLADLQKRFPPPGEIALVGHSHIDLCWLWPYHETRRKLRRTFNTALSLLESSPDYRFNQSTAQYYAQIEKDDPALFERVRAAVKEGRWETLGGSWVEPDTMMPTGESLVRQFLYGQRYFEKTFGVRHTLCWMPDCFGFSGALPQILRQAGIESFFTTKTNWNETNHFPYDLFWWEGNDGSRVLVHTFENPMQGYNAFVRADCFMPTWNNYRGKVDFPTTVVTVGYGDGGGGTTPEMVAREVQLRDFPAIPRATWSRMDDYFAKAHAVAKARTLPVWSGEIYLELHRGTLTSQSAVKRLHRRAEGALILAETVASLAHLLGAGAPANLETLWHLVLKNEFHDILPGSSIHEVYADAEKDLTQVIEAAAKLRDEALDAAVAALPKGPVTDALVVVNPSLDARPLRLNGADGSVFVADAVVPPLAVAIYDRTALTPARDVTAKGLRLENAHLAVEIGEDGAVASLIHKATGRESLAEPGNQIWVTPFDKPREWDAWEIDADYPDTSVRLTEPESVELVESTPERAAVRVVYRFRNSSITVTYALVAGSRRLDIGFELDWHDRRVLVRSQSPVAVRARRGTFESAHGIVERTTHTNTSWDQAMFEGAAHRFLDLSERGFGVALLNDAKYGHSVRDHVLGVSLLRSPVYPDPLCDEGVQRFTCALLPHEGDWVEGRVREEAADLNQPLVWKAASGVAAGVTTPLGVSGIPVALSGLKPAEDGNGLILRVYEPAGASGSVSVAAAPGWTVGESVTLLEEADGRTDAVRPFDLRSWRIVKG